MRLFLTITAFLTFSLAFLTACQNNAAPPPVEVKKTPTNVNNAPKVDEHGHTDDAPRITLADAKKDFDAGKVVFVDTRAEVTYKQERIKGSVNVPMEAFEAKYKEIPTGKKIIAYCS